MNLLWAKANFYNFTDYDWSAVDSVALETHAKSIVVTELMGSLVDNSFWLAILLRVGTI